MPVGLNCVFTWGHWHAYLGRDYSGLDKSSWLVINLWCSPTRCLVRRFSDRGESHWTSVVLFVRFLIFNTVVIFINITSWLVQSGENQSHRDVNILPRISSGYRAPIMMLRILQINQVKNRGTPNEQSWLIGTVYTWKPDPQADFVTGELRSTLLCHRLS